ncbi:MAG: exodeoxyribonuclease III [Pseudomonadota bacterium]|nr:exodeoxyribonuclease III [Pseudomonadota bacterium]
MSRLRIATWNVNSVRVRLPNIVSWMDTVRPDVLLLQELKCETVSFPGSEFETRGYHLAVAGQKAWNGVALISRHPFVDVLDHLPGDPAETQARYVEATVQGVRIASLYAPNGNPVESEKYPYKLRWLKRLEQRAAALLEGDTPFVLGGDFNVIPEALDVYDPRGWENDALYTPETRRAFRGLVNLGLADAFRTLHPRAREYTFWDYQAGAWMQDRGLRIDHFLLSPGAADRLVSCAVDRAPRGESNASDHTPLVLELSVP